MTYQVEYLNPADLIPYEKNAKIHTEAQIAALAKEIADVGFRVPIVVDHEGVIVSGHGRKQAAIRAGLESVPVHRLPADFDPNRIRAMRLFDNRIAETENDKKLLKAEIDALVSMEDFDFSWTGYGKDEIISLLPEEHPFVQNEEERKAREDEKADEVPEVDGNPRGVVRGQVWTLGKHRLMCGDSTSATDVQAIMQGADADLVFTDPPYKIQTEGGCKGKIGPDLRKQGKDIEFIADFDPREFLSVLPIVFPQKRMNAYVFCNKELLPDYLTWARDAGHSFNVLIWKKPSAIPIGDSHRPDIEYLLLFRKSAIWNNGLKEANYSRCLEFGRESGLHPTMKPVSLIENELLISSNAGSVVVDFFGGSGSTLIACEKTGRTCYMMELDEHYCSVIIERWEQFTGQKAELLTSPS